MKLIYCLMIFLWPFMSRGQTDKALTIGDKVPDMVLSPILNYSASKTSLSRFKNKLVILDFMTTGCASCIEALPRFDSLQKKYADQLQIILIIPESEERVRSFLKRKNIANLNLPAIAGDTSLAQLFPHTYISHDVLIKDGKVISITYPEYIVAKNIQSILECRKVHLPVKRDITAFLYKEPLLHLNQSIVPDFSFPVNMGYSTVTSYMDNVPERFTITRDTVKNIIRISMINVPLVDLYMRALYGSGLSPAFIRLEVANPGRYLFKGGTGYRQDWLMNNAYCYEGLFPLNYPASEIKKKMDSDLDFYFRLHGTMEKRDVPCWVITRDSSTQATSLPESNVSVDYAGPQRISVNSIVYALNRNYGNTPAIDESGCGEIKLKGLLKNQYTEIPVLRKKFKEYGLQITRCNRLIDMLVITDHQSK